MRPERWDQIDRLYHAALEVEDEERSRLFVPGKQSLHLSPNAISRQGNRLVFARGVSDANIHRLYLSESGEGKATPTRFLSSSRDDLAPKYSPDGKRIAFESTRTGPRGIWVGDADGSNLVDVFSQSGSGAGSPRWAPDGQRLAFTSNMNGPEAIYVVRVSGGKPIRLTSGPGDDASWSHDGKWIYYVWIQNGEFQIWRVSAEGGKPIQIPGCNGGYCPTESHDGKFLYFNRGRGLWKIPASGEVASEILPSVSDRNFEVVDDGIYFIPYPDKTHKVQLKFLNFANNTVKTITALPDQISLGLAVSPDRRWALYTTNDLSGSDLMLVENFR